jgi:hypothetical protein
MIAFQMGTRGDWYVAPLSISLMNHALAHRAPTANPIHRPATHAAIHVGNK